jgi:hypothetical protein
MPAVLPGKPFYKELIEEIIKEDYSQNGAELKEAILNTLKVKDEKPKTAKPAINLKNILLDGIQVAGSASSTLSEIMAKFDENHTVMENHKKTFLEKLKELIRQITNAEPEEVIYNVDCMDQTKGIPVKEKINFHQFKDDMEKKIRVLSSFVRGPAYAKISVMSEEQIIGYLEKYIKDLQSFHRLLTAMDDFFKTNVDAADREKIKGIKPELTALKNSYVKANQLRHEYSAQKEEAEQMKLLGVSPAAQAAAPIHSEEPPVSA